MFTPAHGLEIIHTHIYLFLPPFTKTDSHHFRDIQRNKLPGPAVFVVEHELGRRHPDTSRGAMFRLQTYDTHSEKPRLLNKGTDKITRPLPRCFSPLVFFWCGRIILSKQFERMAEVWFWLVIMIAAVFGIFALIVHVHSGGAREFAAEMRGPKAEADVEEGGGEEETPTEAAAA